MLPNSFVTISWAARSSCLLTMNLSNGYQHRKCKECFVVGLRLCRSMTSRLNTNHDHKMGMQMFCLGVILLLLQKLASVLLLSSSLIPRVMNFVQHNSKISSFLSFTKVCLLCLQILALSNDRLCTTIDKYGHSCQ